MGYKIVTEDKFYVSIVSIQTDQSRQQCDGYIN